MEYTFKEACELNENFKILAKVLKAEMMKKAFTTDSYEALKAKYEYLTELELTISNEIGIKE